MMGCQYSSGRPLMEVDWKSDQLQKNRLLFRVCINIMQCCVRCECLCIWLQSLVKLLCVVLDIFASLCRIRLLLKDMPELLECCE